MLQRVILQAVTACLFNALVGAILAILLGVSPLLGAVVALVAGVLLSIFAPSGKVLRAGVLTEVWTGELVKTLRGKEQATWLDGIPDASSLSNNNVIHLVDVGGDPDVLINNTTYPIATQPLADGDISISLDKFQTKATPVTDDELYALSYDKMARVKESHATSIANGKFTKAAHSFCGKKNTEKTPVLKTTGEKDAETGRIKMTIKDLIAMKKAMDKLGIPAEGRRLVLCNDHVNDLLETSEAFEKQYNINRTDGTLGRLYGFDIYEYVNTPIYAKNGEKKDIGATAGTGEFQCSFAFYKQRVFKCTGETKMYYSEAKNDPQHQQNLINYRHYFIAMPKKLDSTVVMMSDHKA